MKNIKTVSKKKMEAEVLIKSDMKCCICKERGDHIHHIDSNKKNNVFDNLAFLCFKHHDEATIKGSLSKKLNPLTIKAFRDQWYDKVRNDKALIKQHNEDVFQLTLDAGICIELQKIRMDGLNDEWNKTNEGLWKLNTYESLSGLKARSLAIEILEDVAYRTRFKMPFEIASSLAHVATNYLPLYYSQGHDEITNEIIDIFRRAIQIVQCLVYDGSKYLNNLAIVEVGVEILWKIKRFCLNRKCEILLEEVKSEFEWLLMNAHSEEAKQVIKLYQEHVKNDYPLIPDELYEIIERDEKK